MTTLTKEMARAYLEFWCGNGPDPGGLHQALEAIANGSHKVVSGEPVAWQVRHHGQNGFVSQWNWCYDGADRPARSGSFRCEYRPLYAPIEDTHQ